MSLKATIAAPDRIVEYIAPYFVRTPDGPEREWETRYDLYWADGSRETRHAVPPQWAGLVVRAERRAA